MKRYFMMYESDRICCGSNTHIWGYANSIKTCESYIKKCNESEKELNPRNFKIFDTQGELINGFVPCVYSK